MRVSLNACRQPLPSGFSRFRERTRSDRRAGGGCRRRRDADHLHACPPVRAHPGDGRALPECLLLGRHPSALRGGGARRQAGGNRRPAPRTEKWWRSARRGSIIFTRKARSPTRSTASACISRRRAKPGCRLVIHSRDADEHTGPHPRRGNGQRAVQRGAALLYRRRGAGAARPSSWGFTSPSPAC